MNDCKKLLVQKKLVKPDGLNCHEANFFKRFDYQSYFLTQPSRHDFKLIQKTLNGFTVIEINTEGYSALYFNGLVTVGQALAFCPRAMHVIFNSQLKCLFEYFDSVATYQQQ